MDEAATLQSGKKPKREWMASYNMENPAGSSMQDREIADPVAQEHSDAVPYTLQRSLPGPSGTQVQPRYKNVSIFTSSYRNIYRFHPTFIGLFPHATFSNTA